MASKKELMTIGNIKPTQAYRNTNVNRTRAGIDKGFKRVDQKGDQAVMANFLGEIMKTAPRAMDAWNKETNRENQEEIKKGIAQFKNASPSDRKQLRDDVNSGKLRPEQSWAMMEGVQIARLEAAIPNYGTELFIAYENWEGKLSNEEGAFDEFIENFNDKWNDELSSIDDVVKADHWWPQQTALISQLSSQHMQKASKATRTQMHDTEENGLASTLKSDGKHIVDLAAKEEHLEFLIKTEARRGDIIEEVNQFLVDNPQPGKYKVKSNVVVQTKEEEQLVKELAPNVPVKVNRNHHPPTSLLVENSKVEDIEFEDLYGDDGKESRKAKPVTQRQAAKVKKKKDAVTEGFDPNRSWVQLATFKEKIAKQQLVILEEFVKQFDDDVRAYEKDGQVRLQFKVGISEEKRNDIWTQVANNRDYGHISTTDNPDQKQGIFHEI
jgi:hypothetical protein